MAAGNADSDCVGGWGEWGDCTQTCSYDGSKGEKLRIYSVGSNSTGSGKACPFEDGEEQIRECGKISCKPVDCVGNWTAWSTEGSGKDAKEKRTWVVTQESKYGGAACSVEESKRIETKAISPVDPMKQFTTGEQLYIKGGKDGKYCADEGNIIRCNRGAIGSWEKFRIIKNSDGTYSFKGGKDGKYCADEGNIIRCNRGAIGSWEKFKITGNSDGTYSLKGGKNGKYCADEGNIIRCNRGAIGSWEKFKIGKI
jgi:hypothetical protein